MSFGAFSVYEHYTMSEEEMALLENIEALTQNEHGGEFRYPDRYGDADYCTLYSYTNIKTNAKIVTQSTNLGLDANVEWIRDAVRGLEDNCPRRGSSCDPYSCQEVPYNKN